MGLYRVMSAGELALPFTSCSIWESRPYILLRAELILGVGELACHSSAIRWHGYRANILPPHPLSPAAVRRAGPRVLRVGETCPLMIAALGRIGLAPCLCSRVEVSPSSGNGVSMPQSCERGRPGPTTLLP